MRMKLTQRAYINDMLLEEGAEIGDGTKVPSSAFRPGLHMEGLDDEGKAAMVAYYEANPGVTLDAASKLDTRAPVDPGQMIERLVLALESRNAAPAQHARR